MTARLLYNLMGGKTCLSYSHLLNSYDSAVFLSILSLFFYGNSTALGIQQLTSLVSVIFFLSYCLLGLFLKSCTAKCYSVKITRGNQIKYCKFITLTRLRCEGGKMQKMLGPFKTQKALLFIYIYIQTKNLDCYS